MTIVTGNARRSPCQAAERCRRFQLERQSRGDEGDGLGGTADWRPRARRVGKKRASALSGMMPSPDSVRDEDDGPAELDIAAISLSVSFPVSRPAPSGSRARASGTRPTRQHLGSAWPRSAGMELERRLHGAPGGTAACTVTADAVGHLGVTRFGGREIGRAPRRSARREELPRSGSCRRQPRRAPGSRAGARAPCSSLAIDRRNAATHACPPRAAIEGHRESAEPVFEG